MSLLKEPSLYMWCLAHPSMDHPSRGQRAVWDGVLGGGHLEEPDPGQNTLAPRNIIVRVRASGRGWGVGLASNQFQTCSPFHNRPH
jgi:hypothetical protein